MLELKLNSQSKLVIPAPTQSMLVAMLIMPGVLLTKNVTGAAYSFGRKEGYAESGKLLSKELSSLQSIKNYETYQLQVKIDEIMEKVIDKHSILIKRKNSDSKLSGALLTSDLLKMRFLKYNKSYDILEDFRRMGRLEGYVQARELAKRVIQKEEERYQLNINEKKNRILLIQQLHQKIQNELNALS